jgi:hypothetical protein
MPSIGLLNEKPLHAALKQWCARPGDAVETVVDGYVIDIVRGDLLVEIQTRNLAKMKMKLAALVASHQVRVICPVAKERWIVKPAPSGGTTRRKSPATGRLEDVFAELVSVAGVLPHPNLSVEVLLIREEEARRREPGRHWRRRGWVTQERRLLDVLERRLFEGPADWRPLVPQGLGAFTASELAEATGMTGTAAQQMAYYLRALGVILLIGRRGRANLYTIAV